MSKLIIRFKWIFAKHTHTEMAGMEEGKMRLTKPRVPAFRVFLQVPRICDLNKRREIT